MKESSPKITFDDRLLAVEEQFKQRQHDLALKELAELKEETFEGQPCELGLFSLLKAEGAIFEGNYREALDFGLKAARILADYPLNRRYARAQLILSQVYSSTGDLKNAEIRARDGLAAYRRASDQVGQVDGLNEIARICHLRCDYKTAAEYLTDAVTLVMANPRKVAQFTGNLGMIHIRTGDWDEAEQNLVRSLEYNAENGEEISQARNLLAFGYLNLRRRHMIMANRHFDQALEIISRLGLKREKIIHLEYAGELAFEKGDFFKAKALLGDSYQKGMQLAPASSLVSQSGRRLAEVELVLDNVDEAMKYAQKALELATMLGERLEVGLSKRVIAQVFAGRSEFGEALSYIDEAIQVIREVADPYELARTLLAQAQIKIAADDGETDAVNAILKEAQGLFKQMKLEFWMADSDFHMGMFACRQGELSLGFKKLSQAEQIFVKLDEKAKVRAVSKFLQSLSAQAVALSVSSENQYKIFGNLITPGELSGIDSNRIEGILEILLKKNGGSRAIVFAPESEDQKVVATIDMSAPQAARFTENFEKILGQEISRNKPTLLLDTRRDPFINELIPETGAAVASVIVVPFKLAADATAFLYIDRQCYDNSLNPFSQDDLNFTVGFSDLIAFKWTEAIKNKLLADNIRLKSQLMEEAAFPNIITQDHRFLEVMNQVQQVVDSNISISIEGETGCGKDLLARAIHYNSNRRHKRFISVNCAALPETLLESELFGFKRGAFTGADRDKRGLFEEADGGSFFLDEIADMPLSIQAKILRVMESKEIVRLGETTPRTVDVRVISATNKDLQKQMDDKLFRADLYYRLSAFSFCLPPLRERRADIPLLVGHFLEGTGKSLSSETMQLLCAYDWPGNVRELENEIKKIVLLSGDDEVIDASILTGKFISSGSDNATSEAVVAEPTDGMFFDESYSLYDFLSEHEKRFILKALQEKHGVKKHAAAVLSIPESTLRLKIKQYNIDLKDFGS